MSLTQASIGPKIRGGSVLDPIDIRVDAVQKAYPGSVDRVLDAVSLHIQPGQLACFLGPSGCGKTTLLRSIAGLETIDDGEISLGGTLVAAPKHKLAIPPEKRSLGMVFQHYALWPHMSIAGNIAYPLRRIMKKDERELRVRELADFVGLTFPLDRRPAQLSGGQQQRVALARALARHPRALLLDEPLSNLDASLRTRIRRELRELQQELGITTVLVTHDQDEAAEMADVVFMLGGGRVQEHGTAAKVLEHPRRVETARFVGFENILPIVVESADAVGTKVGLRAGEEYHRWSFPVPTDAVSGEDSFLVIRAERVHLEHASANPEGKVLGGVVTSLSDLRGLVTVQVQCGEHILTARQTAPSLPPGIQIGVPVKVVIDPEWASVAE